MSPDAERRVELWAGMGVGLTFYAANAALAWWFLESLHRGKAALMGVPILALVLTFAEAFAFRKVSDRVASAFVCAGVFACLVALALFATIGEGR